MTHHTYRMQICLHVHVPTHYHHHVGPFNPVEIVLYGCKVSIAIKSGDTFCCLYIDREPTNVFIIDTTVTQQSTVCNFHGGLPDPPCIRKIHKFFESHFCTFASCWFLPVVSLKCCGTYGSIVRFCRLVNCILFVCLSLCGLYCVV